MRRSHDAGCSLRHIATCAFLLFVVAACEEDVAGPEGVEEPFSMYGIINPLLNRQTLLVSPVNDRLESIGESIDAVVTSTDLATGRKYVWHDSVVANATGHLDHIFWADFRPDFGSRHRVEVMRSDGASSSADVVLPLQVRVEYEDHAMQHLIARILGNDVRLVRVEVVYTVRHGEDRHQTGRRDPLTCETPPASYAFSLIESTFETGEGFRTTIDLMRHFDVLTSRYSDDTGAIFYNLPFSNSLALMDLELRLLVGSENWDPPGGEYDANLLAQPGMMRNVRGGFGFVGGGYNRDFRLVPSAEAVENTWFFDYIMRSSDCQDYCSCGWESE